MRRQLADGVLFSVTSIELGILVAQTPVFTLVDWIYIAQHLLVLAVALLRPPSIAHDHSFSANAAVIVSYAYPYAQVALLDWRPGYEAWPAMGLVLVTFAAMLSCISLISLGRSFGVRPALRRLVTRGSYRFTRHPIYLSYLISDVGYVLQEWNVATLLLLVAGWASLFYRIRAEERVLCGDAGWGSYAAAVPYRLLPGVW